MTRRIALAILLTSWAILLLGGAAAYLAIRQALLAELDASLVLRASSLPEVLGVSTSTGATGVPAGDRYIIKGAAGRTVARPEAEAPAPRPAAVVGKRFATLADGTRVRSVTLEFWPSPAAGAAPAAPALTVTYSGAADRFDSLLNRLAGIFLGVGVAASGVVAAVAVRVARRALRPLNDAAATIASIDEHTLDRRLDVAGLPPEIAPVGQRMNQMLQRLQEGVEERKQFLADAAHELRTPVAALWTTLELALRRERDAAFLGQTVATCLGDVKLLRKLIETLLEQFRADATARAAGFVDTNVSELLDLCAESVAAAARNKAITLTRLYRPGVLFPTQPPRLRSIVGNLLSNAIEYGREGGVVEIACDASADDLVVRVRDDGPGIPSELQPRLFQPFRRGAAAVRSDNGHVGLGLYLVKSHADAMGGSARVESGRDGTVFQVVLPRRASARADAARPANAGNFTESAAHHALTNEA